MPKGGSHQKAGAAAPTTPTKGDYLLQEVRRLAKLASVGRTVVAEAMKSYPLDPSRVEAFVRSTIAALREDDFSETVPQEYEDFTINADVYGVRNKEGVWYVKLYMQHGRVVVLSCHAPKFPITCANGRTIYK